MARFNEDIQTRDFKRISLSQWREHRVTEGLYFQSFTLFHVNVFPFSPCWFKHQARKEWKELLCESGVGPSLPLSKSFLTFDAFPAIAIMCTVTFGIMAHEVVLTS